MAGQGARVLVRSGELVMENGIMTGGETKVKVVGKGMCQLKDCEGSEGKLVSCVVEGNRVWTSVKKVEGVLGGLAVWGGGRAAGQRGVDLIGSEVGLCSVGGGCREGEQLRCEEEKPPVKEVLHPPLQRVLLRLACDHCDYTFLCESEM